MIGYARCFDSNEMSFKVGDKILLKNYTKIWGKVSSLMNKEFDREPVYGDNVYTLLEGCIYKIKVTEIENVMNDGLDPSSSDNETDNDSDNDIDNEPDSGESNE